MQYVIKEEMTPCVVFTFSRAKCEKLAQEMQGESLTTGGERNHIKSFFHQSI